MAGPARSLSLQAVSEEPHEALKSLRNMLDNLGMEHGGDAYDVAIRAAVEWLSSENWQNVFIAIERADQEIILQNMENNMGYFTDD